MEIVYHSDDPQVRRYSSIDQYGKYFAMKVGGVMTPIKFDHLDYIDCENIVSHPIVIEFDDEIGYHFPVAVIHCTSDQYPIFNRKEETIKALPSWAGNGFYKSYDDSDVIVNFDNNTALATRNSIKLRIGQDYVLANEVLPADDVVGL